MFGILTSHTSAVLTIEFDGDDLIIDVKTYKETPALWKLITGKTPDGSSYTDPNAMVYQEIMLWTDVMRSEKDPRRPKLNHGYKWSNILLDCEQSLFSQSSLSPAGLERGHDKHIDLL